MSVSSLVSSLKKSRIMSIDPASHSLAWSIIDIDNGKMKIVDFGKIDFSKVAEISGKFEKIKQEIPGLCAKYKPDVAVIEQSVYIQNFQASRILSYIIGFTWGELTDHCSSIRDVNPLEWKSGIGYKNVNKFEVKRIKDEHGEKGIQKRLVDERKLRVKNILKKNFDNQDFDLMDTDITDAIGIGLWYAVSHGNGALQR